MAAAAAAVFALWGTQASAFSLGQIVVLSALGEPLRAEVDIAEMNAEEESSLRAGVASPDAFSSAGLEYNAVMSNLQVSLQKRADGHPYLRISSARAINDPYIDLVLEARWATGRIVGSYTMLIDPPNLRLQSITPTLPQPAAIPVPMAPVPASEAPMPNESAPAQAMPVPSSSAETVQPAPIEPEPPAAATATEVPDTPAATQEQPSAPSISPAPPTPAVMHEPVQAASTEPTEPAPGRITVQRGDTATKIALRHLLPSGVSLDQMLVAMLRANPEVLIDGNINRIRAGAVMTLPTAEQAKATPLVEARQILRAQSRDFNAYRQRLAASAPSAQVASADRRASGTVQAQVEDKKPATSAPDKLTLSKGAVQGKNGSADKIAKELSAKDTAERTESVAKNIAELSKLAASAGAETPTAGTTQQTPAAGLTVATATPASGPAAPPPATPTAAPTPPRPAPATQKPTRPVVAPPVAEPNLLDELLEDPLIPAASGVLVALLGGLAFYRIRQRKQATQFEDSSQDDDKPFGKRR